MFSSGMGMGGMGGGMMSFLIDGKAFDPARIDLTSRINEVEQWTIENRSSMDHPFHLHGTQFQVVSRTRGGVDAGGTVPCLARHRQCRCTRKRCLQGRPAPTRQAHVSLPHSRTREPGNDGRARCGRLIDVYPHLATDSPRAGDDETHPQRARVTCRPDRVDQRIDCGDSRRDTFKTPTSYGS